MCKLGRALQTHANSLLTITKGYYSLCNQTSPKIPDQTELATQATGITC